VKHSLLGMVGQSQTFNLGKLLPLEEEAEFDTLRFGF